MLFYSAGFAAIRCKNLDWPIHPSVDDIKVSLRGVTQRQDRPPCLPQSAWPVLPQPLAPRRVYIINKFDLSKVGDKQKYQIHWYFIGDK